MGFFYSRLKEITMMNILGAVTLAYLAGSGTITNSSVVGRGLFRAIRHAVDGQYREAGVETFAALAAPALMSYASTCSLVVDVVEGAFDLAGPVMDEAGVMPLPRRRAV
jgi:hypothetical protein